MVLIALSPRSSGSFGFQGLFFLCRQASPAELLRDELLVAHQQACLYAALSALSSNRLQGSPPPGNHAGAIHAGALPLIGISIIPSTVLLVWLLRVFVIVPGYRSCCHSYYASQDFARKVTSYLQMFFYFSVRPPHTCVYSFHFLRFSKVRSGCTPWPSRRCRGRVWDLP